MAFSLRRAAMATLLLGALVFALTLLPSVLNPTPPDAQERDRDKRWVSSSPYWIDRQACRWLSVCGIQHIRWDAPALAGDGGQSMLDALKMLALGWSEERTFVEKTDTSDWEMPPSRTVSKHDLRASRASNGARVLDKVPDYVLDHAPLVHLYSGEHFWPSDIAEHAQHIIPFKDGSSVETGKPVHLGNMATLNAENGTIFLTSQDDVEGRPEWLHSRAGVPVPFEDDGVEIGEPEGDDEQVDRPERPEDGTTWWDADKQHPPHRIVPPLKGDLDERRNRWLRRKRSISNAQQPMGGTFQEDTKPDPSGYSKAPATLILVDKGAGIVDAFWFFFYSYNLGQTVLNIRFGNHVGDWEHCMVRFQNGVPRAMFLSEHAGGKAYTWRALEKRAQKGDTPARPVIYSAVGSHAMYASPGIHPYVLPFKLLKDVTDKGPLWDPALNNYAYWFDYEIDQDEDRNATIQERTSLTPASSNPRLPTSWFHYGGTWGDDIYPLSDRRQWRLFGEYHYVTGPLGPKDKWLERRKVCQTEKCTIFDSIEAGKKAAWY